MSGGSYGYLFDKDVEILASGSYNEEIRQMAGRLLELAEEDLAAQTIAVLATLDKTKQELDRAIGPLRAIWKTVEWLDSGDWGPERFDKAVAAYRAEREPQIGRDMNDETHEMACATCRGPFSRGYAYGHGRVFCSPRCREAYPGDTESVLQHVPEKLAAEINGYKERGPFSSSVLNWLWCEGKTLAQANARKSEGT